MAEEHTVGKLRALDLFPDLSEEIDRRIAHAETRIKFWVVSGVVVNLIIAVGAAVPIIYSYGGISAQIQTAATAQNSANMEIAANRKWISDRMVWEARIESALAAEGVRVKKVRNDSGDMP